MSMNSDKNTAADDNGAITDDNNIAPDNTASIGTITDAAPDNAASDDAAPNNVTPDKAPPVWRSALAWVGGFVFLVALAMLLTWLGTLIQPGN